ncbi:MAG: hypothetical protein KAI24_01500 [Planctomycetes bacterium]|nr:hypothetical protein [Planctomycetota bacterium]
MPRRPLLSLLTATLFAQLVTAQDTRRLEIDTTLTKEMVAVARSAASQKAHTLAREIARIVVERYDADSPSARRILGQRKVRDGWQDDGKAPPQDEADERRRKRVERRWKQLKKRAGELHKAYALALVQEGADEAQRTAELELALRYLPNDAELHRALGHREIGGFWGTAKEVAFVQRLLAIQERAQQLRSHAVDVQEVPQAEMPVELKNMGIALYGAKSPRYCYWSSESFEAAATLCTWSERCHEFLAHLLGPKADLVRHDSWRWHLVLRTPEQRDLLLKMSPSTRGPFTFAQAQLFAGIGFRCEAGGRASATWQEPALDADHAVANVTKRHFLNLRNEGLGEGLTHVTTWLLCGSVHTYFADLPKTVSGGEIMKRDPKEWFPRLWREIEQGKDMPLVIVPRERADNFRDSTRLKAWSFMFWMLGAHPDKWLALIDGCGIPKITPKGVEAVFEEVFGKPLGEVEQDWRRWARRDSKLGAASGFRPRS